MRCGRLDNRKGSSVSKLAAINGSAAFFAPLIVISPSSGIPPVMRIRSISLHPALRPFGSVMPCPSRADSVVSQSKANANQEILRFQQENRHKRWCYPFFCSDRDGSDSNVDRGLTASLRSLACCLRRRRFSRNALDKRLGRSLSCEWFWSFTMESIQLR